MNQIRAAVAEQPNHIRSLMYLYGLYVNTNIIIALMNPQVTISCLSWKLETCLALITVPVTFDPVSINACKKWVLLPAFYIKQHDIGLEALTMQSLPQSCRQLLLMHWKAAHMDFTYSWKMVRELDISNTPVFNDKWKLLNLSPHPSSVICREFCAFIFCPHSRRSHSLSHATTWVVWIAFLSARSFTAYLDLCGLLNHDYRLQERKFYA